MPIHILAPEVANQIAAGEVVERSASVVKELIENSLDAGAAEIRVEIREGGRRLVRVQDDGCGIPAAEAALAFERHATSKITAADDLNHLTTLGFRGEALASIASVAQVSLTTRSRDEEVGATIQMVDGRERRREPVGMPPGTIVTVEHLFSNVPARLKFLKQPATEAGHIQQIVTRYAVAYPERRFSMVSDGKPVFQSNGSGKLLDVLLKIYGPEIARQMLVLWLPDAETGRQDDEGGEPERPPAISISGYVGAPSLNRSSRSYISLFVNRRWFQDTSIAYSVVQAYHTMLPVGRYPLAVVFIEMDPADVDVNVHPTKAEVRYRDSRAVFSAVQRAVRGTLHKYAPMPEIGLGAAQPGGPATRLNWDQAEAWTRRRDALLGAGRDPGGTASAARHDFEMPGAGTGPEDRQEPWLSSAPEGASGRWTPHKLPLLRVLGQLGATYIVAEGPDGMYLVDQHAAHERVLYEQLLSQHSGSGPVVQRLLEPQLVDLSPEQAAAVSDDLETLNALGVAIEPFGGGSYLVRSIPAILSRDDPQSALIEIFDGLASGADPVGGSEENRLITLICKRAAVKGGHVLSLAEMQELVRQLEGCDAPRSCPHGRPTMIHLSATQLAHQFGRI